MLFTKAGIHKMFFRIANREDPNQNASDLALLCLSRPFWYTKFENIYWIQTILTCCCMWSKNPLNAGRSEHLTISAQDLSGSQRGAGLGKGFSKATPPVRRNLHSISSTLPL